MLLISWFLIILRSHHFFMWKGNVLSRKIALKNNHYYYYYVTTRLTVLRSTEVQMEVRLFAAGSPTDTVGSQNFRTFSTRQIAFLVVERPMPQCYSDFLLQCAGDIEADHTDSGIVMDCADRNRETHLGD